MIPFAMIGAAGRMGKTIIRLAETELEANKRVKLSGALESKGSSFLGRDAGEISGSAANGIQIVDDPETALAGAKAAIDFSHPENTVRMAELCAKKKIVFIAGTTGLTPDQKTEILKNKNKIPVMISPNMSLGVNLLFHLVSLASAALKDYDIEIVEAHHRHKKDAPSGTAVRLKEILINVLSRSEKDIRYGRQGITGERTGKEIGVHALRGGDTVGDHTVFFMTEGERLELTHRASSRDTFAAGALRAAEFLTGRPPGEYSMFDVLNIRAD